MKFSDRPATERVAISAWVRVITRIREDACMQVSDDFKRERENSISEASPDVARMQQFYAAYRQGRHSVSYTDYFQVTNPEEYAAMLAGEKALPH